jgi:hypothetical protein
MSLTFFDHPTPHRHRAYVPGIGMLIRLVRDGEIWWITSHNIYLKHVIQFSLNMGRVRQLIIVDDF